MLSQDWNDFFQIEKVNEDQEDYTIDLKKSVDEALVSCINQFGRVDMRWLLEATGLSVEYLVEQLDGAIFQDPEKYDKDDVLTGWCLRDQYLSGNILKKLEKAKAMNRQYPGRFSKNVLALEKVLPQRIPFSQIGIGLGSPWIPVYYYALFTKEVLQLTRKPNISFSKALHQWKITLSTSHRKNVMTTRVYGTSRMDVLSIMEHTLNSTTVRIYDKEYRQNFSKEVRVLNKAETMAVQEKQIALQKAFQEWIGKEPKRVRVLEKLYYETFASNVSGRYDGSFLTLPDLNPEVELYEHQRNAIARIILENDTLLAHEVGSGKTYEIIVGLHERIRMSLTKKSLVVVPNNVLEAFETAHKFLYPKDNFLVVHPEDFTPAKREEVLQTIKDGTFTTIYMAYSSFEMIPLSREYKLRAQVEAIRVLRAQIACSTEGWEKRSLTIQADKKSEELVKMRLELPKDTLPCFDTLGVDFLAVDEVHNFKNITLKTHADVVGLRGKGSTKCNDMYEKVQFVRNQGGTVVFSSGTPVTNSLTDIFVLQKYLQPEQLDLLGISTFDEWIGNFGEKQTGFEIDVDSKNYRITTRFSKFHNLPELTNIFANVCDFYNGKTIELGIPTCEDVDIVLKKMDEQENYIEELVIRTEIVRARLVPKEEDNLLKITNDGRVVGLDPRLLDIPIQNPEQTKTYACAKSVYALYEKYPDTTQLVFCDLGTPKKGFNVYNTLKEHLMDMGIPKTEIAFVHNANSDAKRRALFQKVNEGKIRVLLGSTQKLGTGVNVQHKLIAIHHLDLCWKPSEFIQRKGRLVRQGNHNAKVYQYRYVTEGTFDTYSLQILENKQKFISQFMSNALIDREASDVDDMALDYAKIKALCISDPLIKERIDTSNELVRKKGQMRQRNKELADLQSLVDGIPERMRNAKARKKALAKDNRFYQANRSKLSRDERNAFGKDMLALLDKPRFEERKYDSTFGFPILLPSNMNPDKPYIILQGNSDNRYMVDMKDAKDNGVVQRIENTLGHLKKRIQDTRDEMNLMQKEKERALFEMEKGNPFEEEVAILNKTLLNIDEELNRRANEEIL